MRLQVWDAGGADSAHPDTNSIYTYAELGLDPATSGLPPCPAPPCLALHCPALTQRSLDRDCNLRRGPSAAVAKARGSLVTLLNLDAKSIQVVNVPVRS